MMEFVISNSICELQHAQEKEWTQMHNTEVPEERCMKGKQQKSSSENAASEGSSRQLDTFDLEKRRLKEIKRGN